MRCAEDRRDDLDSLERGGREEANETCSAREFATRCAGVERCLNQWWRLHKGAAPGGVLRPPPRESSDLERVPGRCSEAARSLHGRAPSGLVRVLVPNPLPGRSVTLRRRAP